MPERTTAEDRLHRLLHVLPAAARDGGASLAELAAQLGVAEGAVLRDLEEATAATFHRPPGSADPYSILIEAGPAGTTVHVHTTGDFERPARLTPRESLALVLGLRALAAEVVPDRRDALLGLAGRMEAGLGSTIMQADAASREAGAGTAVPASNDVAADDPETLLADAAARRRRCAIRYIKPGGEPEDRTIEPWRMVHAEGRWYVLARDTASDGTRLFRCDRVLRADILEDETFSVPPDFDAATHFPDGRPFAARSAVRATVHYAQPAARWVAEATGHERAADGSVVVEHDVADRTWLVRHVLGFGGAAVVQQPEELRAQVAASALRVVRAGGHQSHTEARGARGHGG